MFSQHSHFKLGMVLGLGVLHIACQIHIRHISTSCFTTYFIFRHNMVNCQIFVALFSATMYNSHFRLDMEGVLHVTYQIRVWQLSTSCFTTRFIFRHNMVKCQIFDKLCGGIRVSSYRFLVYCRF